MNPRRGLTEGEVALARTIFGDAIDYARVTLHARGYLPFGLQHGATTMAPDGNLYLMPAQYRDDFAHEEYGFQLLLIHELTHVWQYQLGYPVLWHGLLIALAGGYLRARAYRYDARLAAGAATFSEFNMEQQADLLAHYFGARQLGLAAHLPRLARLEAVLARFLHDPHDARHLPHAGLAGIMRNLRP